MPYIPSSLYIPFCLPSIHLHTEQPKGVWGVSMAGFRRIIKLAYYKAKFRNQHVILKSGCNIGGFHTFFEGRNVIGVNTIFSGSIGYGSYIGNDSSIQAKIGRYCSISDHVRVIAGNHPTRTFVSTHPAFFSTRKQAGFTYTTEDTFEEVSYAEGKDYVVVGNDIWIGSGAVLINGIRIGDGAVIAAGAVVTKDVEPYAIVGGVPAKVIRKRFSEEQIRRLEEIQWWDWPEAKIREQKSQFGDIDIFLDKFNEGRKDRTLCQEHVEDGI